MGNTLDAKRVRAGLAKQGVYTTQAGIDSMSEPGERASARRTLRQLVAELADGDLFCLCLLAGILTECQAEGAACGGVGAVAADEPPADMGELRAMERLIERGV